MLKLHILVEVYSTFKSIFFLNTTGDGLPKPLAHFFEEDSLDTV